MKIGKLAKLTGCSIQTIRYYEKEKLLSPPQRSEGNYRIYSQANLEQLTFIKHCRNLDITLSEIKQIIEIQRSPSNQCIEINNLVENQIKKIDCRIDELNELKDSLVSLSNKCNIKTTVENCGILSNLQLTD